MGGADGAGRDGTKVRDALTMGTGDEKHPRPGSQAVIAAARLRAQQGEGARLDTPRPQIDPETPEQQPPPSPRGQPRSPAAAPKPPAKGSRRRERRGAPQPRERPPTGSFPRPTRRLASPTPGDHLRPSPPPLVTQVHPGSPPLGRPRSRSRTWREPIKTGDRKTRGHTVQRRPSSRR